MIRIITDTGSDIPYLSAGDLGLESIELGVQFEEFPYDYRDDLDFSVFFDKLIRAKNLPTTSQVTPGQYMEIFEWAKESGDELVVITLSGGLSGTYSAALMALESCDYDGITVIDSKQCTITQRMLVEHAVKLRDAGKSRAEIAAEIEDLRERVTLVVVLDTLKYLKKGGRVPPTMAFLGEVLNLKPVVTVREGKSEPIGRARGFEAGKRMLWAKVEADGLDENWPVYFGYSRDKARGETFLRETREKFGLGDCPLHPVGGVIGTHGGPNGVAIGYVRKK
ncbi:MAG: DegV family protein [Oscillospiraceae bacterium]|nr:DegV family protein [Oscillospiraceae bacterium]